MVRVQLPLPNPIKPVIRDWLDFFVVFSTALQVYKKLIAPPAKSHPKMLKYTLNRPHTPKALFDLLL
ncbi:hypothetical protein B0681_06490 [Moraxella porci DSM 25326]|uniref:Uncharacterized protein n=1 Tax=Moraxella porci DSM 25326 TaxID=573983 RepID=A0A1T0CRC1_9GAMM|nr:hypothetical protein B0681_06490 [Moraxella porci DSM 25326]